MSYSAQQESIVPWIGIPVGIVGALLVIVYVVGAARRPMTRAEPPESS